MADAPPLPGSSPPLLAEEVPPRSDMPSLPADPPLPDEAPSASSRAAGKRKAVEIEEDEDEDSDFADDGDEPVWRPEDGGNPPLPPGPPPEEPISEAEPLDEQPAEPLSGAIKKGEWTAVWSPQMNAYFFHNSKTKQITWDNPLDPNAANATPGGSSAPTPLKPSRDLGGIDPDLAYLDPTLAHGPRAQIAGGFAARFNARTGKFEGDPNRNPDSVSEFTRQRKKEEFYFDVGAHDSQRAKEQMERIAQGKDPSLKAQRREVKLTKAELDYFKQKNAEDKRRRQTTWLLNDEGREAVRPGMRRKRY